MTGQYGPRTGVYTVGGKNAPQRDLFWHFPGYLGAGKDSWRTTPGGVIRSGDWKLLEVFEDGRKELYNLRDDEAQKRDLAAKQADKVKELHARLVAWRKTVSAPMPAANKRWAIPFRDRCRRPSTW